MNSHCPGTSGSPYSAIHECPAPSLVYRRMSSSGTPQETAPNSSGYPVNMLPTSRPPLERPRGQPLAGRHPAGHQVPGDRREVLVGAVPLLAQRRPVPARAVLAAAADVRHHVHTAAGVGASPVGAAPRSAVRRSSHARPTVPEYDGVREVWKPP